MGSICRFLPTKEYHGSIQPIYFVYETEFHKLKQPFIYAIYYIFLVTKGSAVLHMLGNSYTLAVGTLFVIYPGFPCTMEGSDDFTYMYISFTGDGAGELVAQTGLTIEHPVYAQLDHLIPFWRSGIQRIEPANANILTECVLLYTLSFLTESRTDSTSENSKNAVFENILKFVDHHYTEKDITLKKLAGIYAYSEKYLSWLFKQNMNMNFSEYLNKKRITHALRCIGESMTNIADIAESSGYGDPLYFTKVFKKYHGVPPSTYIKHHQANTNPDK